MKTLEKILALAIIACLVTSCEKELSVNPFPNEILPAYTFQAEFVVSDVSDLPEKNSTEWLRTWVGAGESALMGEFSVKMSFLSNMVDLSFCNLIGSFEAQDGSVLFFSIAEGQMESNEGEGLDNCDYIFNDLAVIRGGTGRFAGAKGSFYPNAMIFNGQGSDWNAQFSSKGDIQIMISRQPGSIQEP